MAVSTASNSDRWVDIAGRIDTWLASQAIEPRDTVVLVPFVQLLPHARRAFGTRGGLMPRIETTRTLAAALGPALLPSAGAPTLDGAADAVLARQMLALQSWGAQWRRSDSRGFDRGAVRLVAATHEIIRAAADVAPASRDDWWARLRDSCAPPSGPGGRERALARIAIEWAALAGAAPTDRLFALYPSAWIAIRAGGTDRMIDAVFGSARSPCLVVDTDVASREWPDIDSGLTVPAYAECAGFEQEAEAAAAQVLEHLGRGERPVVLLAADRVVVRRIRALLERAGASILDETGWKLSTTRAAAGVMALLAATEREATTDQLFAWLKSGSGVPRDDAFAHVAALEAVCRKRAIWRIDALARSTLDHREAEAGRRAALAWLALLQGAASRPIVAWLEALERILDGTGALSALQADEAGRQVIGVLGLAHGPGAGPTRFGVADEPVLLAGFTQWVDETLEQATFRPSNDADVADVAGGDGGDGADVVITPLARAMLRPFAAAVMPGADDRHLGAYAADDSLLSSATRTALGVVTPAERLQAEWLAFVHLLVLPHVTLLRRRSEGAEPLSTSPFVEQLSLSLAERGRKLRSWTDPSRQQEVAVQPVRRLGAVAATRLPARLSATSYEALRACPYRFFATRMLGVKEDAELDGDLEKRDYGSWLHQVLHTFHEARPRPWESAEADESKLRAAALDTLAGSGFDAAEFLPWSSAFDAFVPRYVSWLRAREARGASWMQGEARFSIKPPALGGVELEGVIDRIDAIGSDDGATVELIDYKTGSAQSLKERVADPFEDTQLAFYAALVAQDGQAVKATYLPLEGRPELREVEHHKVARSAVALIEGIAIDLSRIRSGADLMPLGEGAACRFCEARGLCRRDHWNE